MKIYVKTVTAQKITLDVEPNHPLDDLKELVYQCLDIPCDDQRLIYRGMQLEDGGTLWDYDITNGDTLHLVFRLRGMISRFTSNNRTDPLVSFLMDHDESQPFQLSDELRQALERKSAKEDVSRFPSFFFDPNAAVLHESQMAVLGRFMSFIRTKRFPCRADVKMIIPNECFKSLLEPLDFAVRNQHKTQNLRYILKSIFSRVPGAERLAPYKIALRLTTGPTNACINFHCDGIYASSTSQIALNDASEYEGGRLCYFVNGILHILERPAGSLVQHPPKVLHAVTALRKGVRKSLFLVDEANGLGESDVHTVTIEDIEAFRASIPVPSHCVACTSALSNQVLVPCGHAPFCRECTGSQKPSQCPICGVPIREIIRLFFF